MSSNRLLGQARGFSEAPAPVQGETRWHQSHTHSSVICWTQKEAFESWILFLLQHVQSCCSASCPLLRLLSVSHRNPTESRRSFIQVVSHFSLSRVLPFCVHQGQCTWKTVRGSPTFPSIWLWWGRLACCWRCCRVYPAPSSPKTAPLARWAGSAPSGTHWRLSSSSAGLSLVSFSSGKVDKQPHRIGSWLEKVKFIFCYNRWLKAQTLNAEQVNISWLNNNLWVTSGGTHFVKEHLQTKLPWELTPKYKLSQFLKRGCCTDVSWV